MNPPVIGFFFGLAIFLFVLMFAWRLVYDPRDER